MLRVSTYHRGNNQGQDDDDDQQGNKYSTPIALIWIAGNQLEEAKNERKKKEIKKESIGKIINIKWVIPMQIS